MFIYCCLSDFNFQISLNVFAWLLQYSAKLSLLLLEILLFLCCALHQFTIKSAIILCAFMHFPSLTICDIKQSLRRRRRGKEVL